MLLHMNTLSFYNTFSFGIFTDVDNGNKRVHSLLRHVEAMEQVIADHRLINFLSRLSFSEEDNSLSC